MNPSADSAAKGWELIDELISQALPSEELSAFLWFFLKRFARPVQESSAVTRRRSRVATAELRAPDAKANFAKFKAERPKLAQKALDNFAKYRNSSSSTVS